MKRIKVQDKLSKGIALIICAISILIVLVCAYYVITSDFVSSHTRFEFYGLIGMIAVFIPMWINNTKSNVPYVSELILIDDKLVLVYKSDKDDINVDIDLDDIEKFNVILNVNRVASGRSVTQFSETKVEIKTKDGNSIKFTENPTASLAFCNYTFMFRLLDIARDIPNFSYRVEGNDDSAKADVANYALFGKRLNFIKREFINLRKMPVISKTLLGICVVLMLFSLSLSLYFTMPTFNSSTDKKYLSYVEQGYSYFQNNDYEQALIEYDKALNIHNDDSRLYYYRALSYEYAKQYEKCIAEAQKGIEYLGVKSAYMAAKGYKFSSNNDIGLYTTLGDCSRWIKDYRTGLEAYNYVIKHVKYRYTDAYYKRGKCEYYLGQTEEALKDFYIHKSIVNQYLQEQENSEYKAVYPTYKHSDLEKIEEWIESCKTQMN